MYTPCLLAIGEPSPCSGADLPAAARLGLSSLPVVHPAVRLFAVARGGWFGGRRWHRGDLVACVDTPDSCASAWGSVVLEARGHGRPRLGSRDGLALYGDGGEACSPRRWRVAGEVVAVLRRDGSEPGGSDEGVHHPGVPGWRVIGLTVGAVGTLLDGPPAPVAPVESAGGAAATEQSVGVSLHLVSGPGARPSGGRAHRSPGAWAPRGQLSLFAESAARAA